MRGVSGMYNNLKLLLERKRITTKQYSDFLGIAEKTAYNKLNGLTKFYYDEYVKTCKLLFPEYNPEYVFAEDDNEG